jgi:hypothetical protein
MSYGHCASKMYEPSPVMGPVSTRLKDKVGGGKYRTVSSMHASITYDATAYFTRSSKSDPGTSGVVRIYLFSNITGGIPNTRDVGVGSFK